jgi:hypothetical protein
MERHRPPQPHIQKFSVRNRVLECKLESANERCQLAQIILPWSRVKGVLTELHGGWSGGHMGVNRTLFKVLQRYYWLQGSGGIERWCRLCDICAASRGPRTRNRDQMQQYNVGAPSSRLAIDVVGPFPWSDQGNRYLLIAVAIARQRL